jgi:nucleoside-diphosphate-sugar epimerase
MQKLEALYQSLLEPSNELIEDISKLKGDILILGVGGKMGPALAKLAKQAIDKAGVNKKVIGAARFSEPGLQEELNSLGIETYKADLLKEEELKSLPDTENVLYLAGLKFGTSGNAPLTWAMNSYLPGRVAEKYANSRIVVFSSGNVYPLMPVYSGGATEIISPEPFGEYAQSCLGRERMFEHFSQKHKTPLLIYRLNFACDVTYGVLLEIGLAVKENRDLDLTMGHLNAIWQGDANEIAIRSLHHCQWPRKILNVTGPETISVRWCAEEFGRIFGQSPKFINEEQSTCYLNNAAESARLFGYPKTPLKSMIELMAQWINADGKRLNKPTHFQERKGKY